MPKHSYFLPDFSTVHVRSRGHLPHWDMPDGTYSITFRLADSLPAHVVHRLREEREALKRRGTTAIDRIAVTRTFERRFDDSLDSSFGVCHLRDDRLAALVADNLRHFDGIRYDLFAWCVMPNHVHVVIRALGGQSLATIVHSWKSYTAKLANKILGRDGEFWQREYFDRIIRDQDDLTQTIAYVLANPAKAGLVNWPWVWSASPPLLP